MNYFNLLPLQQQPVRAQLQQWQRFFYGGAVIFCVILILVYGSYHYKIANLNIHIAQLQQAQTLQETAYVKAKQFTQTLGQYQKKITTLQTHQEENLRLLGFLQQLPAMVTADLYLVSLSWHAHSGVIYGQAVDHQAVVAFMQQLKNNTYFKKVELIKSDRRHERDHLPPIYFVIHFYVNS